MRPIFSALRRRAGLIFSATVVISGTLAAPVLAISVAPSRHAGRTPSSAASAVDVIWTVGVLLAVIAVVAVVVFRGLIRDRAGSILGSRGRRMRGLQSRPQH
jgi:hypothetical protein